MRALTTISVVLLTAATSAATFRDAYGQAGPTGWGWCPVCGSDVWISTHDFSHGRNQPRRSSPSRGGSRPTSSPTAAPQQTLNQQRAKAAYFRGLELWNEKDSMGAIRQLEYAAQQDPSDPQIREKLRYFRREHEDMWLTSEMYYHAVQMMALGEADKAINDLRLACSRFVHGDTDFARQVRDELQRALELKSKQEAERSVRDEAERQERLRRHRRIVAECLANFPDVRVEAGELDDLFDFDRPLGSTERPSASVETAATMSFPPLDDARWLFEKGIVGSPPVDARVQGPSRLDADPLSALPTPAADLLRSKLDIPLQTFRRERNGEVRFETGSSDLFAPDRIARDAEILAPWDAAKFRQLDDQVAIELLVKRHEAAEAEERRRMLDELTKRIDRLVRELGDDRTDLETLERTNPEFAARLQKEREAIERESQARIHKRYAADLELLASKLVSAGNQAKTPSGSFVESVLQGEDLALRAARTRAFDQAVVVAQAAHSQGLFDGINNVQDLERRQASDRRLADVIRQIERISQARQAQEQKIRTRTLEALYATGFMSLEPLLEMYNQ